MGGILLNPNGIIEIKFTWVLGRKTNNQAKMYGLLQGLCIAKDKGIKYIIILGVSLITIHHLIKEGRPKENYLSLVLKSIRGFLASFHSKEFYHILIINNPDFDLQEYKDYSLEETKL